MRRIEFYTVLTILILESTVVIVPIALSYFAASITIKSSGQIIAIKTPITYKSEIRGVFIFETVFEVSHNWTLIAETLAQYGINAVFVNDFSTFGRRFDDEISTAINAFHARGIEYHSVMAVLQDCKPDESLGTEEITPEGEIYNLYSHCPIKAHDYVISAIQDYIGNHSNVDGIMLDFIRYSDQAETCYCPYCRAAFEEWLGEGPITNWTLFYPDQPRWEEFLNWRNVPLTSLVKDIHDTIKTINPNILISEAAWTLFGDCPIYWRKYIGQDTAAWIKEGYIDFAAPMMYSEDQTEVEDQINTNIKYWLGGQPEGPIPLVGFFDCSRGATPAQIKAHIDYARSASLDGWILWRYGGPGLQSDYPDIRNYLSILYMPETFTIANIEVETSTNSATISWITTLPTTSRVEYNTISLFGALWETWDEFPYWNITRAQGILVVENKANVTEHSVILNNLTPGTKYYYRVQSKGISGIATSRVLTFTTKS
jgi:hypothetical protein